MGQASPLIFMLLMFGVFYFLLIRPQVKRQKELQAMIAALQKGDEVVTNGGLIGKISGLSERFVTVELQEKVRVRVVRDSIRSKWDPNRSAGPQDKAA